MTEQTDTDNAFSVVMITLFKGVMYADEDPKLWQNLLSLQARIREYVATIGLDLIIFEDEGFAWLKTSDSRAEDAELPRLVGKRQLSYPVSLLLALLRRRLAEHDATSGESRLIVSREEIVQMLRTFLPLGTNEAKIVNQIDSYVNKAVDLGFVRRLRNEPGKIEVRRILKAFVDAQWLNEFDARLQRYLSAGGGTAIDEEDPE
jgi:Domain of unknown function (DUF4194)